MSDDHLVLLAERYGQLSNEHDLNGIAEMLSEDASDVYGHAGKEQAMRGMEQFRQTYRDVVWEFGKFEQEGPRSVRFDFNRFWTDAVSGKVKMTSAVEVIHFNDKDKIMAITYKEPPLKAVDAEYPKQGK